MKNSLLKAFLLLSIPLVEFVSLRLFLHHVLELHIGYSFMTDYDFVFPSIISFCFLIVLMEMEKPLNLKFYTSGLKFHVLSFVLFVALCFAVKNNLSPYALYLWYPAAIITLLSGLAVFLSPKEFFAHPRKHLLWFALLASGSKIFCRHLFSSLWEPAAQVTAQLSCGILQPFLKSLTCEYQVAKFSGTYQIMSHPLYTVAIGDGCSGLEGVFFFSFAALLYLMARGEKWSPFQSLGFLFVGALGIFLLNTFRICFYYLTVLGIHSLYGPSASRQAFELLFHMSLGWVLYTLYIYAYIALWTRVSFRKPLKLETAEVTRGL